MRTRTKVLLGIVVLFGVIQLVPYRVPPAEPEQGSDHPAPPEVLGLLERGCYDCHSNATVVPWYGHVAPASWLLAYDVGEGRRELNFSNWELYDPAAQAKLRRKIADEVREGDMPPWYYLPLHSAARLTAAERAAVERWAAGDSPAR